MASTPLPLLQVLAHFRSTQTGILGRYRLDDATLRHILAGVQHRPSPSLWRHVLSWIIGHLGLSKVNVAWLANLLGQMIGIALILVAAAGACFIVYLLVRGMRSLSRRQSGDSVQPTQSFEFGPTAPVRFAPSGLRGVFEQWVQHLQRLQIIRHASGVTNGDLYTALASHRPLLANRFRQIRPALDLCFYAPDRLRDDDARSLEAEIRELDANT